MSKSVKHSHKRGADLSKNSFTELVVRVFRNKANGSSGLQSKTRPIQNANTKNRVVVFHKRKDKSNHADVLGTRTISTWRRFSGHNKSWKTCRRLKLTQDYLELLSSSNGRPVSFGWQFSTTNAPISFIRGQRLRVNKQSKPRKTKKLASFPTTKDLDDEYDPDWPMPKVPPHEYCHIRGDVQNQGDADELPRRLVRLNIKYEAVDIVEESSLENFKLATRQSPPLRTGEPQSDILPKRLVVRDLVGNESLVDIYLVQDPEKRSESYHAHAFLSDATFTRRKVDRLRKSPDFFAETVQLGRRIIVMKILFKANETFVLKNTQREFPSLPGTETKPPKAARRKHRRSYAAVLAQERVARPSKKGPKSNHIAYAAWQERNGTRNPKKEHGTVTPIATDPLETNLEGFTVVTKKKEKKRKIPGGHLVCPFAAPDAPGVGVHCC